MTDQVSSLIIRIDGGQARNDASALGGSLDQLRGKGETVTGAFDRLKTQLGSTDAALIALRGSTVMAVAAEDSMARATQANTAALNGLQGSVNGLTSSMQKAIQNTQSMGSATTLGAKALATHSAETRIGAEALGVFEHASNRAKTELIVLLHELSQGNTRRFGGSLMVLAEQMNWAEKIMSPLGLGIGLVVGAIVVLGEAVIKGAADVHNFNTAIQQSGGYAGLTRTQYEAMVASIAGQTNGKLAEARGTLNDLVRSGKFTSESLGEVARAIEDIADVSGEDSKKVTADFAKMTANVREWAKESNDAYHFLRPDQYQYIIDLVNQGRNQEAAAMSSRLLAEAMEKQKAPLSESAKLWHELGTEINQAWDDLKKFSTGDGEGFLAQFKGLASVIQAMRGANGPGGAFQYSAGLGQAGANDSSAAAAAAKKSAEDQARAAGVEAIDYTDKLNDSIKRQIKSLQEQAAEFGKTRVAAVEYAKAQALKDPKLQQEGPAHSALLASFNTQRAAAQALDNLDAQKKAVAELLQERREEYSLALQADKRYVEAVISQEKHNAVIEEEIRLGRTLTESEKKQVELHADLIAVSQTSLDIEERKGVALENQNDELRKQIELVGRIIAQIEKDDPNNKKPGSGAGGYSYNDVNRYVKTQTDKENNDFTKKSDALHGPGADQAAIKAGTTVNAQIERLAQEHQDKLDAIAREGANLKKKLRDEELSATSQMFGDLGEVAKAFGKKGFEVYKATAIAQTIMSTYQGAQNAFTAMSSIPYVGPALGIAAAAAAIAAGVARVASIEGQQFSAAGGFDIPSGVNPVTQLHQNEMVLPAWIAGPLRDGIRNGGSGSQAPIVNISNAPAGSNPSVAWDGQALTIDMAPGIINAAVSQSRSAVASDMKNPGSQISKSMKATHGTRPRAAV